MRINHHAMLLVIMMIGFCNLVVLESKHVAVKNRLGDGRNMTLHCQSKDNDLGQQNIADGDEFGWNFKDNILGTTLFYCDMWWESVPDFSFEAYSFARDRVRCSNTGCMWLVASEGMYGLNGQTGFWEYIYQWPTEAKT